MDGGVRFLAGGWLPGVDYGVHVFRIRGGVWCRGFRAVDRSGRPFKSCVPLPVLVSLVEQVQKRWGFKVALFLVQEMRDAKLDISLEHYRGAILACSRTRQLAGVLPLLEEMQTRGVAADVETFNAAISSCTVEQVSKRCPGVVIT